MLLQIKKLLLSVQAPGTICSNEDVDDGDDHEGTCRMLKAASAPDLDSMQLLLLNELCELVKTKVVHEAPEPQALVGTLC